MDESKNTFNSSDRLLSDKSSNSIFSRLLKYLTFGYVLWLLSGLIIVTNIYLDYKCQHIGLIDDTYIYENTSPIQNTLKRDVSSTYECQSDYDCNNGYCKLIRSINGTGLH